MAAEGHANPDQEFQLLAARQAVLDGIVLSVLTDPQAMAAQLEGGALDVALNLAVTDFIRLRDNPKYRPLTFSAGNFSCLGMSCQVPPWDNKKARQGLLYAVDRVRWANTVQKGLEFPSTLPWPKTSAAYDDARRMRTSSIWKRPPRCSRPRA